MREQWNLAKCPPGPEFGQRLAYNSAVSGSFRKAGELSARWGSAISDDAIHALVRRIAGNREGMAPPVAPPPGPPEPAFRLVIMIADRMARQRGADWGAKPGSSPLERVAWKEVRSAVVCRLESRVAYASGRGLLIEKKVVAVPPDTDVVTLGAMIHAEALRCGLPGPKRFSSSRTVPSESGT